MRDTTKIGRFNQDPRARIKHRGGERRQSNSLGDPRTEQSTHPPQPKTRLVVEFRDRREWSEACVTIRAYIVGH